MAKKKMTMGVIVGNHGFFPDHMAKSGREEMLRVLESDGIDVVALTPERGFEHHVAANLSTVAATVHGASSRYLGWDMYYHGRENGAC